jgi:hypothetical protein
MKKLLLFFLVVFLLSKAFSQPSIDIGLFGGVGSYIGDVSKISFTKSVNPAYGGFVRYNFNPRYGLRFNVVDGQIGASGKAEYYNSSSSNDGPELITNGNYSFKKNVLDVSLNFEWNYLKYIVGEKTTPWSTFLYGGIGVQTYKYNGVQDGTSGTVITPTIPFGLGFKFNLSKRWGFGLEGGMRKTFSDKLDNLDDPLSYQSGDQMIKYTDSSHNNDWTTYVGIHLVYKLIYGNKNWELKTRRNKMIDWGIQNKIRKE